MQKIILPYGNDKIEYYWCVKNVKNINLSVKRTGEIVVSSSSIVPQEVVDKFVLKKSRWIIKNQRYFANTQNFTANERQYVSGENYIYLGKQYRLKVVEQTAEGVSIKDEHLYLYVKNKNAVCKKKWMINRWYAEQTRSKLSDIFEETRKKYDSYFNTNCKFVIRQMTSRWGSCNTKSNLITLNSNLIYAPKYCIEYVVLHELCHLKFSNHSKSYYELLGNLMPDWEIRKQILDEEVLKNIGSNSN